MALKRTVCVMKWPVFCLAALWALLACEKVELGEVENSDGRHGNLVLKVNTTTDAMESTRAGDVAWQRLNFVAYQNGTKVTALNQEAGDDGFGEAVIDLPVGTYQVLVLAHSSNGNPSLASAEKIQFTNANGFSDTFYYYGDIQVTDEQQTHTVQLVRVTSMLRFIINDDIPASVETLRFYYTGGSGALNAKTGYGCVASQQSVFVKVDRSGGRPYVFEVYTIPREEKATLSLKVTAYTANNETVVLERSFKNVTVERNKITEFAGDFFTGSDENPNGGGGGGSDSPKQNGDSFVITADTEWGGTIGLSY